MPIITTAGIWEEVAAAFEWHVPLESYYHTPRWARAAMLAYGRLRARLDYWTSEWSRGKQLPEVTITPG